MPRLTTTSAARACRSRNHEGAPEGSRTSARPFPLPTRSPRRKKQREHVCALWLTWGAATQGLSGALRALNDGLRRAGRPHIPPAGCPHKSPRMLPAPRQRGFFLTTASALITPPGKSP